MNTESKQISGDHLNKIIDILSKYKSIHENIGVLEEKISKMLEDKDFLLKELELARSDEQFFVAELESLYGPGKLNPVTMTWDLVK